MKVSDYKIDQDMANVNFLLLLSFYNYYINMYKY